MFAKKRKPRSEAARLRVYFFLFFFAFFFAAMVVNLKYNF